MSRSPGETCARLCAERRRILRHERHRDLVPVLVLELLAGGEDARMVVAERQRAEAAEEIEDAAAVAGDVVHALGAIDDDLVEAEQLHEVQLAGIEVRREQVDHLLRRSSALASSTVKQGGLWQPVAREVGCIGDGAAALRRLMLACSCSVHSLSSVQAGCGLEAPATGAAVLLGAVFLVGGDQHVLVAILRRPAELALGLASSRAGSPRRRSGTAPGPSSAC